MHPDLSAHLHSDECNTLIDMLKECRNSNQLLKFVGACTDLDSAVYKCLMKEREANRKKNADLAKKNREKWKESAEKT